MHFLQALSHLCAHKPEISSTSALLVANPTPNHQPSPPQAPQLKYRLPSEPSVWCDLLDDEDVTLM